MKLLVTGGAGYIGSVVTRLLLDEGHELVVLDNLERGHREAVAPQARLVVADMRDADTIRSVVAEGFDGVLHFAAYALVAESVKEPGMYYRNNVVGTLNLLDAMVAAQVPRLVFSSTCAVYGQPDEVPISESAVPRPMNPYGASKLAADRAITDFCIGHQVGATSLRYFNVAGAHLGAGEDHEPETHLIPNLLKVAAGLKETAEIFGTDYPTPDGTAIRDYIHIDDLATAHLLALHSSLSGNHAIYNLGNGTGFSVREVIETAERITGRPVPAVESSRRPGDPPRLVAAAGKITAELGWKPQKPRLETMVADAWQFQCAHPSGYSPAASESRDEVR